MVVPQCTTYRGGGGDGEKCLDFGNSLKGQSTSFVKGLDVGCKKEDYRMNVRLFVSRFFQISEEILEVK